jgi:phenylacetate-CoA ligase
MSKWNEIMRLHIILPIAETIKGTCAYKWLRIIKQMQSWTPEQVVEWQERQLQSFIKHAYEHTIYYRRVMDERGLTPEDIQTAEDLKKLPIMTKQIANAHFNEIVPDNLSSFKYRKGKTGGTTGEPMYYYCDEDTWGYVTAAKIFYWSKVGYQYGDPFVAMGSASLFAKKPTLVRRIYDRIRNEIPMNTVNLTDELCAKYVETIRKKNIRYIYGYAASIYLFTKYVKTHNIDLTQVQAVYTTSENLTDEYRELIELTYDCSVVDCYGARDAGITAYETKYHHYEVGYNVIAEIINPIEANTGTLLTTNFLNYSFPLIRYQFGDEVEIAPRMSKSEYNGQLIKRILGRTSDVMRLENGHNMTATGFSMIMKEFDVIAFSFNKTGVNEVTLKIQPVKEKYNENQEAEIMRTIRLYIGEDAKLKVEYVEKFEALANGKRRYFMNS